MKEKEPDPSRRGAGREAGDAAASGDAASGDIDALRAELATVCEALIASEREQRSAQDREKLLRHEVQHRVRNMLAIIRSVYSRTVESGHAPDQASDHFRGRLDTLARLQMAQGPDPGGASDLEDMIRNELQNFSFDERIEISGADTAVPHHMVHLLGLALHELATNSIKFGVLSAIDERMHLNIRWTSSDHGLVLTWEETGVAVLASVPVRIGFGREFIEQGLPYQIAATTSFEFRPGGLSCTISVPVRVSGDGESSHLWR